jgi:hypothetical protein
MLSMQPQSAVTIWLAPVAFSAATLSLTIAVETSGCLREGAAEAAAFGFVVVVGEGHVAQAGQQLAADQGAHLAAGRARCAA